MTVRLPRLPPSFRGRVIDPADPGYDTSRKIWKGLDRRPALIAGCADAADVQRVVEFAALEGVPLAVVGAGHDVAARSMPDDALVAATGALDTILIDPDRRTARVGSGVRWGTLVAAAAEYGLATTGASVATVGVAGFALHGGLGWLMRSLGAACDNIRELELVTADGRLRTVDAAADPDLFWAMRGAGANFGVVTSLTLRLYPVDRVVAGMMLYPADKARDVLRAYREITARAGAELVTHFYYASSPDGSHSTGIGLCYNGTPADLAGILAPLAAIGAPSQDSVRAMGSDELQHVHDSSTPPGARYHLRGQYFSELSDAAIDVIVERCRTVDAPFTQIILEHLGGAVGRIPLSDTAFSGRDAEYSFLVLNGWNATQGDSTQGDSMQGDSTQGDSTQGDSTQVAWTRDFGAALEPYAAPGAYVNYLDYDEDHRIPEAYRDAYPRLRTLKRRYDPTNMFRFNRNIPPEAVQ